MASLQFFNNPHPWPCLSGGFIIDKLTRRINIRAEYDIQCDILDDPITKKSLQVTADNHANQIDGLICEDGRWIQLQVGFHKEHDAV